MIQALRVRGPYRGASGHDHHVREFVRHLARSGVRLQLVDIPEWAPVMLPDDARDPWFDTLGEPVDARITLDFCMPHQVTTVLGARAVNYTMFEASRIPRQWAAHARGHDLVIVPTESSRQAWLAGGVSAARVVVCPLGVDAERFHPGASPIDLRAPDGRPIATYRTRVLNVSDVTPRKNLESLLRVWIRTTSRSDDAILVLKLGHSRPGAARALLCDLEAAERTMGKSRGDAAPILFLDRVLADSEMPGLFAAATHYWSMSRGEGWDQPMVEAAAAGLQLIAPRHSAYEAYLDDSVATLISARAVPATVADDPGLRRLFAEALWWEPDEAMAAAAIRQAVQGAARATARARVVPALSWTAATDRLLALLAAVGESPGPRSCGPSDEDSLGRVLDAALTRPSELTRASLDAVVAALDPANAAWAPALAALVYARPELAGPALVTRLEALLASGGLGDAALQAVAIVLEALASADLASSALTTVTRILSRDDVAPATRARLLGVLGVYVSWCPGLLDVPALVALGEQFPLIVDRDTLLTYVIEPLLARAPERATTTLVERIVAVFGGCRRLPHTLQLLSDRPATAPAVRVRTAGLTAPAFPERIAARSVLTRGPFHVLVVFNVRIGQGDEIIRLVPLLQALLDANPRLDVTLVTARPYLYDHPRVRTVPITDERRVEAALAVPANGVVHVQEPSWLQVSLDPTLDRRVRDLVAACRPSVIVTGGHGHGVYLSVEVEGRDITTERSLDRMGAPNVYDAGRRLLMELGLPTRAAEESPRGPCVMTGARSADAERAWTTLTAGTSRPVALVNLFGGAHRIKGYFSERPDRLTAQLTGLLHEGYRVVLIPNGTPWGSRQTAIDVVARLAPETRPHVTVAPDPAELDPAWCIELAERSDLPYADRVMRLFKYFASSADLVIAVEGFMAHLAYQLGRPFRLLLAPQSFGAAWCPWPCGPRQGLTPSLSPRVTDAPADSLGPDEPPPMPPKHRKALFFAALAGVHRLGAGRAVPMLLRALASEDHDVRAAAVAALGRLLPEEAARGPVLAGLGDREPDVRGAAAEALLASGIDCSPELGAGFRDVLAAHRDIARQTWAPVLRLGIAALPALVVAAAAGECVPIRREARWALGRVLSGVGIVPLGLRRDETRSGSIVA